MKKLDFNFDVSALSNYTEEPAELIRNAVTKARTMEYVTIQTGIKSAETINYIGGGVTFQAGGTCGFNASGDRTISQRTITVCDLKVNEEFCMKTLEAKFTQKLLSPGSTYDMDDIPQIFIDDISEKIAYEYEKLLWMGDTAGAGNLSLCDGYKKLITNATACVRSSSGTTFTGNEITVMKQLELDIPENIRDAQDLVCFMGRDWFTQYQHEVFDLNNRWVAPEDGTDGRLLFSDIPIVVVSGLTSQNFIALTTRSNMYVGCDMENETEQFKLWFSEDDDIHKLKVESGVQVAFPENVVYYAQ
jgi:hypothetical protein